jgi:hypothetical protein
MVHYCNYLGDIEVINQKRKHNMYMCFTRSCQICPGYDNRRPQPSGGKSVQQYKVQGSLLKGPVPPEKHAAIHEKLLNNCHNYFQMFVSRFGAFTIDLRGGCVPPRSDAHCKLTRVTWGGGGLQLVHKEEHHPF